MSYNCYSCFTQLNLLISSEDDQSSITCNNCGIINYINNLRHNIVFAKAHPSNHQGKWGNGRKGKQQNNKANI